MVKATAPENAKVAFSNIVAINEDDIQSNINGPSYQRTMLRILLVIIILDILILDSIIIAFLCILSAYGSFCLTVPYDANLSTSAELSYSK